MSGKKGHDHQSPSGNSGQKSPGRRGQGRLARLALVLETIKFSHTLFALPFAAVGAVWARQGVPGLYESLLLLLAMVAARTCAMSFNRVIDARLDAANPRTSSRAIPAGLLSRRYVLALGIISGSIFLAAAAAFWPLLGNPWPAMLALPVLGLLIGYSYTKRFTMLSHYVLGASLGLAPVGAWVALTGGIGWMPVMLGTAVIFWTAGFDILYSLQDMDHDRRSGLRSIPARLGPERSLLMAEFNHLLSMGLLLALYHLRLDDYIDGPRLGWLYMGGAIVFYALIFYEHRLLKPDNLSRLNRAFFHANAMGSMLFAAFAVADVLLV